MFLNWFDIDTSCDIKVLWFGTVLNQWPKYLKINIFFFKVLKTNTKKETLEKPKKEKLLLSITENIGNRKLSVCKTMKYQLNIEKKNYKVFQELNISNVSIFLIDCQSYTFLLMNIIISDIFI